MLQSNQLPINNWTIINKEIFWPDPDYQISPYQPSPIASSTSTINSAPTYVRPNDHIEEFKKDIKRDPSLLAVHKDERKWDNWQQYAIALSRAQGVEDVLDVFYAPTDRVNIFCLKRK
jgi:hypothetical protein